MKAHVLHAVGDLRYQDVPVPEPAAGWRLVKVAAAGICSSDVPRILERGTYRFPTIPGHEFSGTVVDSPNGNGLPEGARVGVFPLIPCRACPSCARGEYETCANYDYLGSRRDGGFAEYVAVPEWNLVPLPDEASFEEAAMLEPLAVAVHSLHRVSCVAGTRVAVMGSGAIGMLAAQVVLALGASESVVVGRSEAKRSIVELLSGVRYAIEKDVAPGSFDLVVEAVGTPSSVESALALASPGSAVVLMGNPAGDMGLSRDAYWSVLRKQLTLFGTWNSSYESSCGSDWSEALRLLVEGTVDVAPLITHRFDKCDVLKGLSLMHGGKESYCKVMTIWS